MARRIGHTGLVTSVSARGGRTVVTVAPAMGDPNRVTIVPPIPVSPSVGDAVEDGRTGRVGGQPYERVLLSVLRATDEASRAAKEEAYRLRVEPTLPPEREP